MGVGDQRARATSAVKSAGGEIRVCSQLRSPFFSHVTPAVSNLNTFLGRSLFRTVLAWQWIARTEEFAWRHGEKDTQPTRGTLLALSLALAAFPR